MAAIVRQRSAAPVSSQTYVTKSKGLQVVNSQLKRTATGQRLTSAQRRANTIARTAASYRKSRLQAAQRTIAKYNAVRRQANTAAVAAFAVKQTALQSMRGHQNRNLQHRIFTDYGRHVTLLGRLQFAQAGERRYVTQAVMNTVTSKQATAYATYIYNLAQRGLRLASATASKQAPTRNRRMSALPASGYSVPGGPARPTTARTPRQRQAAASSLVAGGPRSMDWLGRPEDPNCVPVAAANALLFSTGFRMPRLLFRRFSRACGPKPTIPEALSILWELLRDSECPVRLVQFWPVARPVAGCIVGYESPYGPHAALALPGGLVASWGQEIACDETAEEAWAVSWRRA